MRIKHNRALLIASVTVLSTGTDAMGREDELRRGFAEVVRPFLEQHCLKCHSGKKSKAQLDLSHFASARDVARGFAKWKHVVERVKADEMPPKKALSQPTAKARRVFLQWSRSLRNFEAERTAGDPGPVLAHRLNAAEYNYTIRDLTGVDIQPARQFPVDPANEAGFDNSGESLTMTPGLLSKYLDAARFVSDHLVLKSDGVAFASHPVVTVTDRDKYCVRRIIAFYEKQNTEYADYFLAAWRLRQQHGLDDPGAALVDAARQSRLSPKYLARIWSLLAGEKHHFGPIAKVRSMWRSLPDTDAKLEQARAGCAAMSEYVRRLREELRHEFPHIRVEGINNGTQSFVLWRNRQYATHRMSLNEDTLSVASDAPRDEEDGLDPAKSLDSELVVPADEPLRAHHIDAFKAFCTIFPDTFYVSRRGREFSETQGVQLEKEGSVRLLSAGFHSQMGYFRDDRPLYELLLGKQEQRELDVLWQELDVIAEAPTRQHQGYIWYERAESLFLGTEEFDFARAADKDVTSRAKMAKLAKVYLAKAGRLGATEKALGAIKEHFRIIDASIRQAEQARQSARPLHLRALESIAEQAYRRPLEDAERSEVHEFYDLLRKRAGLEHEDAVRDVLVRILTSPHFCFRTHPSNAAEPVHPLSDYALASRLSYFLWSSMPDGELLSTAARNELHKPDVLLSQVRRMLKDDRVKGLATEFGGHWLGFRHFQQHNSVDRGRFPSFDDDLRQAMFEEPIRFLVDLIQRDGALLDSLYADHTFVNATLAAHYGIEDLSLEAGEWARVKKADRYGRGGILPMSVFLTKNAPGLRTSPVKRGHWVVRQLLGERIPTPPPEVPELPGDEAKLGEFTLREVLARHREHESCSVCHNRFDSIGVVFEGFGPIGEQRSVDLGGRTIETAAKLPDGVERKGVVGLRGYLQEHRQAEFVDNVCQKLLSYALGRTLIVSDDRLLRQMRDGLVKDDHRFTSLIESIVTSPQFLRQRGRNYRHEE
jgi:hypothetical protein